MQERSPSDSFLVEGKSALKRSLVNIIRRTLFCSLFYTAKLGLFAVNLKRSHVSTPGNKGRVAEPCRPPIQYSHTRIHLPRSGRRGKAQRRLEKLTKGKIRSVTFALAISLRYSTCIIKQSIRLLAYSPGPLRGLTMQLFEAALFRLQFRLVHQSQSGTFNHHGKFCKEM